MKRVMLIALILSVSLSAEQIRLRPISGGLFPLSANNHYLVSPGNRPFPILGRASWALIGRGTADYQTYITDTAARGFNTIEVGIPWRYTTGINTSYNVPFAGNSEAPFLKKLDGGNWTGALTYSNINNDAPDFTTPNENFWTYVDTFVQYCATKNILVAMFPAYTGYPNGTDGWMLEMAANGTAKMQTYGAFIANRYKNQKNLVWLIAGDYGSGDVPYTGSDATYVQALVTGLVSVSPVKLISAEGGGNSISSELPGTLGTAISLNGAYTSYTPTYGRNAYSHSPTTPSYIIEEPYDEEGPDGTNVNPFATQPVRRFIWWGMLTSVGGYIQGNGYIWPFQSAWSSHLNTTNTQCLTILNNYVRSARWYDLIPSGLGSIGTIVTAGGSTLGLSDYVTAAVTQDGKYLVAYIPPAHTGTITIDMSMMSGSTTGRWFDVTNGTYTAIGSGFANSGTRVFTIPGNNSLGNADWLLVLDA